MELTVGKQSATYAVTPLASDFGRAFRLEKGTEGGTGQTYHTNLDLDTGRHSCECNGFLHHGHGKHADGPAALIAAGRL